MKFHTKWRKFLTEGGNVFKGERVDSIPLAFIQPTLEQYYEELSKLFPYKQKAQPNKELRL